MLLSGLVLTAALASNPALTTASDPIVHLRADLYGARMDTPLRVPRVAASGEDPLSVMDANTRALGELAAWVELSAEAVDLDDYGRFRLVVAAIDALPVRTVVGGGRGTVTDALAAGRWGPDGRLLAIAGGLRAAGVATQVFEDGRGRLFVGISCLDADLNVDAVEHRWRRHQGGQTREIRVRWVIWDGEGPVGRVDYDGALRALDSAPPTGRALRLVDARAPAFTLSRAVPHAVQAQGGLGTVFVVRHPDAAGWLALAPERHLPAALPAARAHVRASGLLDVARRAIAGLPTEAERVDALIRLVQGTFVYEPGPVRTVPELLERGRGDCDQLSLVLGALLLELGYDASDLVIVSWPDHLGLAIRPRGTFPDGVAHLTLDEGRYVLVDVTHYVWAGGRLVSSWGRTSPRHGTQVTVQRL